MLYNGTPFTFVIDHEPFKFWMELNQLIRKLVRWILILQEYDFNIVYRASTVNRNPDGLNWIPSANENDTKKAYCHRDIYLEAILGWHASLYLCIMLGCYKDVLHNRMGNKDSCNLEIKSKGYGTLDIYENAHVMAYLQVYEVLVGWTPKSAIRLCIRFSGSS
jgi:hypothetical protein